MDLLHIAHEMTSHEELSNVEMMPNMDGNENLDDTTTLNVIATHETALSELAATISSHGSHPEGISPARSEDGEEQALEVHEVIELQAYDERKWITEQVKAGGIALWTWACADGVSSFSIVSRQSIYSPV
jgi:hypothetical protein